MDWHFKMKNRERGGEFLEEPRRNGRSTHFNLGPVQTYLKCRPDVCPFSGRAPKGMLSGRIRFGVRTCDHLIFIYLFIFFLFSSILELLKLFTACPIAFSSHLINLSHLFTKFYS
jgi:hypothetical protein